MSIATFDDEPWGRKPGEEQRPWGEDETRRLRMLVHNDATDRVIAAMLGRTVRAIAIKRQRLGLTIRNLPRPGSVMTLSDDTLIRELRSRGYHVSDGGPRVLSGDEI